MTPHGDVEVQGGYTMEITEVEQTIRAGLEVLMKKAELLWPGEHAQFLERNLTHYVGAGMPADFGVVYEWPFEKSKGKDKGWNLLDMVAFRRRDRVLVLAESKRIYNAVSEGGAALKQDVQRITRAAAKLKCWNYKKREAERLLGAVTLGVLLVSVSGNDKIAARRRETLSLAVGLGEWPEPISHSDHTYHALYKVWRLGMSSVGHSWRK
jgi:hypothetical protein